MKNSENRESLRKKRISQILAEEKAAVEEISLKFGPVHCDFSKIQLGGINCAVIVRCKHPLLESTQEGDDEEENTMDDGVNSGLSEQQNNFRTYQSEDINVEDAKRFVLYIQATDEHFGEYSLETTLSEVLSFTVKSNKLPDHDGCINLRCSPACGQTFDLVGE